MTVGSNIYPADYPRLAPIPTDGCPLFNTTVLKSVQSNDTSYPIMPTTSGRFDLGMSNDNAFPLRFNNSTAVPMDSQSKDDGQVLDGRSISICHQLVLLTFYDTKLSEKYCNSIVNKIALIATCFVNLEKCFQ